VSKAVSEKTGVDASTIEGTITGAVYAGNKIRKALTLAREGYSAPGMM